MVTENISGPINCACVIHGDAYSWTYVDRLYKMLSRHLSRPVILHVYTEASRKVPRPYVKHELIDWGISGKKQSWWYKMQLFNNEFYSGPLLYFDLDTVIVDNIDWIWNLNLDYFWSIRDFKYLWNSLSYSANSSIMWFDTAKFHNIWHTFKSKNLSQILSKYRGDQDYISSHIQVNFFDEERVKSWRWQCLDGGYDFTKKKHLAPNTGTVVQHPTSVLIFHGNPKPDQTDDVLINQHWQ